MLKTHIRNSNIVTQGIVHLMKNKKVWIGTAKQLCVELKTIIENPDPYIASHTIPILLTRINSQLEEFGIQVATAITSSYKFIVLVKLPIVTIFDGDTNNRIVLDQAALNTVAGGGLWWSERIDKFGKLKPLRMSVKDNTLVIE